MIQHARLFFGANVVLKILSIFNILIVTPMYMRYFGVENYGIYTYIFSWVSLLSLLSSFGFVEYLRAYACLEKDKTQQLSMIYSGCVMIVCFSLLIVVVFLILVFFDIVAIKVSGVFLLLIVLAAIITPLFSLGSALLLGFSLLKQYYNIKIITFVISMIGIVSLVFLKFSLWHFVLWHFVLILIGLILYFYILHRHNFFAMKGFDMRIVYKAIPTSLAFTINTGALVSISFADKYLIMHMLGEYSLGVYAAAFFMIYAIFNFVYTPIEMYLDGFIKTAVRHKNQDRILQLINLQVYCISIIFGAVLFAYIIYGRRFLSAYIGNDFATAHDISLLIAIAILCNKFVMVFFNVVILQHKKANRYQAFVNVCALILNVVLNYMWIPMYGILGAVYASFVTLILASIINVTLIQTKYHYRIITGNVFVYIAIIVGVYILGYMFWDDSYGIIRGFVFSSISFMACVLLSFVTGTPQQYIRIILKKEAI